MSRGADPALLVASEAILSERYEAAKKAANRDKVYALYTVGSHRSDNDPAVQIVEDALRANIIAEATFRSQQADRFAEALDRLRRYKP